MKIVDARSGTIIPLPSAVATTTWAPGHEPRIDYGNGESITVLKVEPGLLRARALTKQTYRDVGDVHLRLRTTVGWNPLTVRWMHPGFRFQHVAFLNT